MSLLYTDEEGARVFANELYPDENIYEEKHTLLWAFIKIEGDDEELLHLEQKILEMTRHLDLDYAGWRLFEGWAEFYFYGESAKGFENALNEALKPKYQFESGNRRDKKYETYKTLLLPNATEYHTIQSEMIISELEEVGDDLEAEHRIEHHALFMTKTQRARFIEAVQEAGFDFLNEFLVEKSEDDYVYGIVFTKLSGVSFEILAKQTEDIFPLIKQEHGRYEGWGTDAVTMNEMSDEEE